VTLHQNLLDGEIGTLPPSTLDIDALITRQRRQARLRNAGIGGLVVALVLMVGAVFVVLPRGEGTDRIPVAESPSPSLSPRAAEAARLTAALQQLVSQALPGATLGKVPARRQGEQTAEPLVFVDRGTEFEAAAVVTDAQGPGIITVRVGKLESSFSAERACSSDPAPLDVRLQCEVVAGADGAIIMKLTADIGFENYRRHLVQVLRADGNEVWFEVSNGVPEIDKPDRGLRPQPLLTMDQALAMAQEPSLATTLP
jgi:hypothetical protein